MTTYGLSLRATAVFEKITIQTVSLRVSDDRLTVFDGRDSGQDVGWICSGLIDHEKRGGISPVNFVPFIFTYC